MELVSEYLKRIDPQSKDKEKLFGYINMLIEKKDYSADEIIKLISKDNMRRKLLSEKEDNFYRRRRAFGLDVSSTWFDETSMPDPPPTLQSRGDVFWANELRHDWRNAFVREYLGEWVEDDGTNSDTN